MGKTSKLLSLILRHQPARFGVALDRAGWTGVDELLAALAKHGTVLTRDELARLVAESDKQRFALSEDGARIRANQGHSVEVELDLPQVEPPEHLFHGTVAAALPAIRRTGLEKRARHHVHMSDVVSTASTVGLRRGAPVILTIRAKEMAAAGHAFYRSANGVWLADHVPARFIDFPAEETDLARLLAEALDAAPVSAGHVGDDRRGPRGSAAAIAQSTLAALEQGRYDLACVEATVVYEAAPAITASHAVIAGDEAAPAIAASHASTADDEAAPAIAASQASTAGDEAAPAIAASHASTAPDGGAAAHATAVSVAAESSLAAIARLGEPCCVLNFASAKSPGGGFLRGAVAQEETLARSSGLYPCLVAHQHLYDRERANRDPMYRDAALYSPRVPFFRDDDGAWIPVVHASVITCAAPNAAALRGRDDRAAIEAALRRRAEMILAIAAHHGERRLILGAWGCGVFGNAPGTVAEIFRGLLAGRFASAFAEVVFSVLPGLNLDAFGRVFEQ